MLIDGLAIQCVKRFEIEHWLREAEEKERKVIHASSLFLRCSMEIKIPQMRYAPDCPNPPSPVTYGYDLRLGNRASACVSKCTAVKYQVSHLTHKHIAEVF